VAGKNFRELDYQTGYDDAMGAGRHFNRKGYRAFLKMKELSFRMY
jgi:hypothetical protein